MSKGRLTTLSSRWRGLHPGLRHTGVPLGRRISSQRPCQRRHHRRGTLRSFQYPTGAAGSSDRPSVTSVTPSMGSTNVAPLMTIVMHFNKIIDRKPSPAPSWSRKMDKSLTGRLDFLDTNRSARFTPDSAYKAGSRIRRVRPRDRRVSERTYSLSTLRCVFHGSRHGAPSHLRGSLDTRTVQADTAWLRAGQVALRGYRVLRFIPATLMEAGLEHVLTVSAWVIR